MSCFRYDYYKYRFYRQFFLLFTHWFVRKLRRQRKLRKIDKKFCWWRERDFLPHDKPGTVMRLSEKGTLLHSNVVQLNRILGTNEFCLKTSGFRFALRRPRWNSMLLIANLELNFFILSTSIEKEAWLSFEDKLKGRNNSFILRLI